MKWVLWIILGGIVGWFVSLVMGRDFKGGCLAYVVVGIITMVLIGVLVKVFWTVVVIALIIAALAWLFDLARR